MPADASGTFDEGYFGAGSVYERFADADAAAEALTDWYHGLFHLLGRRYDATYPIAGPVLEVGTGHGALLRLLRRQGLKPVGADLSTFILGAQRALDASAPLVAADACRLPFSTNSFRSVLTFEMLEHVPEPLDALAELSRVLEPGGVLIATTPNPRADVLPLYDSKSDPTHVSVQTPEWWSDALTTLGFESVRVTTYLQVPLLWRRWALARRVVELRGLGPTCLLMARRP